MRTRSDLLLLLSFWKDANFNGSLVYSSYWTSPFCDNTVSLPARNRILWVISFPLCACWDHERCRLMVIWRNYALYNMRIDIALLKFIGWLVCSYDCSELWRGSEMMQLIYFLLRPTTDLWTTRKFFFTFISQNYRLVREHTVILVYV